MLLVKSLLTATVGGLLVLASATAALSATLYEATQLPGLLSLRHLSPHTPYMYTGFHLTNQGQAIYEVYTPYTEQGLGYSTYVWESERGSTRLNPLATPSSSETRIFRITDAGWVLFIQISSGETFGFDLNTGTYAAISYLTPQTATGVNLSTGDAVTLDLDGYSPSVPRLGGEQVQDEMRFLTSLALGGNPYYGANSLPISYGTNTLDQAVGRIGRTATFWDDGQAYDLNVLSNFNYVAGAGTLSFPYRLVAATAINDQGQILAVAAPEVAALPGLVYLLKPVVEEPQEGSSSISEPGFSVLAWVLGLALGARGLRPRGS